MKKLNLLLVFCISSIFVSCISKEEKSIVGVWQLINHEGLLIEFDRDGLYYLLDSNERITSEDSTVLRYSYNPKTNKEFNFRLEDTTLDYKHEGNLTFKNPNNIYISYKGRNQSSFQAEYIRVKSN